MLTRILTGAAVAAIAQPASAVVFEKPYAFDFTKGGQVSGTGTNKTITWTNSGISVTAKAWYLTSANGTANAATIQQYAQGLGVTSGSEPDTSPQHSIDNLGNYDFITLTFSRPMQLVNGILTSFTGDNDAWVSFTLDQKGNSITNAANWADLKLHGTEVLGNGSSNPMFLNPGMNTGNIWIVGADKFNQLDRDDGFKLSGITVQIPAPEPATWATMMIGVGIVGATLRRRKVTFQALA